MANDSIDMYSDSDDMGIDAGDYDYTHYLDPETMALVQTSWLSDRAFIPTTIVYGVAFFIGVTGNSLVIFALGGDKKARHATGSFLISLAVADLLFLVICVPYEMAAKMALFVAGGSVLCKVSGYVEMLSACASILNLTAVSLERYVVIVHPMKTRSWFTMRNTVKIILAVWTLALALSSPLIYIMDTTVTMYYNNSTRLIMDSCLDTNYPGENGRLVFAWYQLVVMFLIPVLMMAYCYAVVIRVLWLSTKQLAMMTARTDGGDESRHLTSQSISVSRPRGRHRVKDQTEDVREARKQVIRMLLTIIFIFLVCWGPKLILTLMKRHELDVLHRDSAFEIGLAINLLPYIQSASNPIIYGFMSKNLRQSLRTAFKIRCHCDPVTLCGRHNERRRRREDFSMTGLSTKNTTRVNGRYSLTDANTQMTSMTVDYDG